jgi:hypothetical protein
MPTKVQHYSLTSSVLYFHFRTLHLPRALSNHRHTSLRCHKMPGSMAPPPSPAKKKRRIAPRLLISPLTQSPHFTIQTIPKKGKGLIAIQKIEALSTVLLEEPPILTIPSTMDENDDLALGVWLEEYLRNFTPEVAAEKRTATYQLANSHPNKPGLVGILIMNGFQLPLTEEDWPSCRGLFLQISRINHACEPNCAQRWDGEKRVMVVVPVRDIEVGEEITVTYLTDGACQGLEARRDWLMCKFRFWCRCELCAREAGDGTEGNEGEIEGSQALGGASKDGGKEANEASDGASEE